MKKPHYKYLFMSLACFLLIGLISLTYSKFSYSKELSGNIVTVAIYESVFDTLTEKGYTLDTSVNFLNSPSTSNGQGLMMRSSTQNDTYPIYYYRGNVSDNNVVYAGYCWLIVRTTETGGTKIVYNGEVNNDGSCNNYSGVSGAAVNSNHTNAYIDEVYNYGEGDSIKYSGYMWGGTDVYWKYNSEDIYIKDYLTFLSLNSIDSGTGRHVQNLNNSIIKTLVDNWYLANIDGKTVENLLEDTVWCNDRSVSESYSDTTDYGTFAAGSRISYDSMVPSFACNDIDKFTVSITNGNGDLDYPIGLLTADEMALSGGFSDAISYLKIADDSIWWSMTPGVFYSSTSNGKNFELWTHVFAVGDTWSYSGSMTYYQLPIYSGGLAGVRPSVSLKNTTNVLDGTGTFADPYIVG